MKRASLFPLSPGLVLAGCVSGFALGALSLGGCASSAPLRFYTLSEVPPGQSAPASNAPMNGIRVGRVRLPAELDRLDLVQRLDANRVRISDQNRWAAPLDDMIRRVLTADLQARTGERANATAYANPEGAQSGERQPATHTLDLDISEFSGDTTCAVTLRASWQLLKPGTSGEYAGGGSADIHVPGNTPGECTVGALPPAMSRALAELSDRILAPR